MQAPVAYISLQIQGSRFDVLLSMITGPVLVAARVSDCMQTSTLTNDDLLSVAGFSASIGRLQTIEPFLAKRAMMFSFPALHSGTRVGGQPSASGERYMLSIIELPSVRSTSKGFGDAFAISSTQVPLNYIIPQTSRGNIVQECVDVSHSCTVLWEHGRHIPFRRVLMGPS